MTTPASGPASPPAPARPVLDGKVAVITGGTRGIGRAVAEAYLASGARVVVNGRDEQTGQAMLASLDAGGALAFRPGDITGRPAVDDLIDFTAEHFGRLDIVFLNAGGAAHTAQ